MILVTGASGHVGNVLVRELVNAGEKVRALVLPQEKTNSIDGLDIEYVEGNVLDPDSLDRAMQGIERVYHLAGIISICPGQEDIMYRVNVHGTRNVANAALKAGVKRMVHVSSIHALKPLPHGITIDETAPIAIDRPLGTYDRTKAEGTLMILDAVKRGLDAVIVCPTGIIGPNDYLKSEMGQTILNFTHRKLHMLIDGAYDFVDVRDVAKGIILAMNHGRTGEIYILAGNHIKINEIKAITQNITGIHTPAVILPYKIARALSKVMEQFYRVTHTTPRFTSYALETVNNNSIVSYANAQRELGYTPRPLRETIRDIIDWWKMHRLSMSLKR